MEIYIGNIPEGVDDYDLRKFIGVSGGETRFRIIDKSGKNGRRIRYGYADIEPARLAIKAMSRNHGREWLGHKITVREFRHRSYSNERRTLNWREIDWQGAERRHVDRRGKGKLNRTSHDEPVRLYAEL
ncbi:MAG: RNA-binding protein [Granulosicoccaceae bacterium]|jgi:RNA recognition motif-containing protein